jgi:transcriptional regulator with XRE-family HTH domain
MALEKGGHVPTLKQARMARLITVRELAQKAKVAPSTVHLTETGRTVPRFTVIKRLSAALDVEPATIVEFAVAMGVANKEHH